MKKTKRTSKILFFGVLPLIGIGACLYVSTWLHLMLLSKGQRIPSLDLETCLSSIQTSEPNRLLFLCLMAGWLLLIVSLYLVAIVPYHSRTRQLAANVTTPVAAGQGQHGTAAFLEKRQLARVFPQIELPFQDKGVIQLLKAGNRDMRMNSETGQAEAGCGRIVAERIHTDTERIHSDTERTSSDADPITIVPLVQQVTQAGIVLGMDRTSKAERLFCVTEDTHALTIGATRSGKTRTIVLQTIGALGLAGESMVMSDPKGELHQYTAPFLERIGYRVVTLDFRTPAKSHRFNYLQAIIDAVDADDLSKAVDATWDMTAALVGEAKGERIWTDGEAAVIACAIIAVVFDNRPIQEAEADELRGAWLEERNHECASYRNLGNVYAFLANMCALVNGELPLVEYMASLPEGHPARALAAISSVAPQRTQGSFYTAALATLRLFTNPNIHLMTDTSDFILSAIGEEKTAVFIILPDEKTTYYSLASLFASQCYEQLVRAADARGGRLKIRTNFILDEFGNFTQIPDFENKLTVGGGRGIRFMLFLQSFAQLQKKYGEEAARIIRGNCETWIYLQAEDGETLKEISEKLGNYTVSTFSVSGSRGGGKSGDSHSMQLTGRPLMTADEIRLIGRPYCLVLSRNHPALMHAPDISQMMFNTMFGMGDMEHNRRLRLERERRRPACHSGGQPRFWGIWNEYVRILEIKSTMRSVRTS